MYFQYGPFQHDSNLVDVESFTQRFTRSPRGSRQTVVKTLTIAGDLIPSTASQDAIRTKIEALETAYNSDNYDAGLYHDDGTRSPHFLQNAQSLSGVQVKEVDYPQGDNPRKGEYVTSRKFRIVLEAEYLADLALGLVAYQESISVRGNGGPRFAVQELDSQPPVIEQVSNYTPVYITQTGSAIGLSTYPAPGNPLSASGLVRQNPNDAPTKGYPEIRGSAYINYPIQWRYEFISASTQPTFSPALV